MRPWAYRVNAVSFAVLTLAAIALSVGYWPGDPGWMVAGLGAAALFAVNAGLLWRRVPWAGPVGVWAAAALPSASTSAASSARGTGDASAGVSTAASSIAAVRAPGTSASHSRQAPASTLRLRPEYPTGSKGDMPAPSPQKARPHCVIVAAFEACVVLPPRTSRPGPTWTDPRGTRAGRSGSSAGRGRPPRR